MLVFSEITVNVPMQARMLVVVVRGDRAWDGRGGTKGGQEMPLLWLWQMDFYRGGGACKGPNSEIQGEACNGPPFHRG